MREVIDFFQTYFSTMSRPATIRITDVVEIIILAVLIYYIVLWVRNTKAWTLLKGVGVLLAFYATAVAFELNTITWLINQTINVILIAGVVIFQPELRKAVEQLGRKNFFTRFTFDNGKLEDNSFTEKTVNEIARAAFELSKTKTGALMVIEREISLAEFERTGIELDAILTSQMLINIFEHNTPLHDGAAIIRGNRITAATCYLPLSDSTVISKDLGTRHRAGIGVSEETDSFTVIVSEETGAVSLAYEGQLLHDLTMEELKTELNKLRSEKPAAKVRKMLWKGKVKSERSADK